MKLPQGVTKASIVRRWDNGRGISMEQLAARYGCARFEIEDLIAEVMQRKMKEVQP